MMSLNAVPQLQNEQQFWSQQVLLKGLHLSGLADELLGRFPWLSNATHFEAFRSALTPIRPAFVDRYVVKWLNSVIYMILNVLFLSSKLVNISSWAPPKPSRVF